MPSPDETFPIVDAHQHFWDLERNDYPWLRTTEPIAFRYGDYGPISGLPADRSLDGRAPWRDAMRAVASCKNVVVKISGLGQCGRPWTLDANRPVIRDTIEIFGVDRCMFASNFPVDRLVGSFEVIYSGFRRAVADLPLADQRKPFHDNAERIYRLAAETPAHGGHP